MLKKALTGIGLLLLAAIVIPYAWIGMGDKPFNDEARALAPGEFVELSEGRLHFVWIEPAPDVANGEVVVMLHGLYVPHFMFMQNAEALTKAGYRVLLPDHYGHGFSDRPGRKYNRDFFITEVNELLSELDLNQSFYLAGQSTGGLIAAQYTAEYPERVKGLMLIVPAGIRMHGEANTLSAKLLRTPAIGDWMWRILARPALRKPSPPPCDLCGNGPLLGDPYLQAEYRGYFAAMLSILRHYPLRDQDGDYRALGATGVPTIALFGGQDETVHIDSAEVLASIAPGIEIITIENGDHAMNFRQSELINPVLLEFLDGSTPTLSDTASPVAVAD